jgi:hypothetical protein
MRTMLFAFVAAALFVAPAGAATGPDPLMSPVHQFIDGFNKGNDKAVKASFVTTGLAIIDEVPPHVWTGPNALAAWIKDLAATDRKEGNTDQSVTLGTPTREIAAGTRGYVVVPAVYHFKRHSVVMREPAQMTFSLQKVSGTWLITGWTWVGTKPRPAK